MTFLLRNTLGFLFVYIPAITIEKQNLGGTKNENFSKKQSGKQTSSWIF